MHWKLMGQSKEASSNKCWYGLCISYLFALKKGDEKKMEINVRPLELKEVTCYFRNEDIGKDS